MIQRVHIPKGTKNNAAIFELWVNGFQYEDTNTESMMSGRVNGTLWFSWEVHLSKILGYQQFPVNELTHSAARNQDLS